MPKPTNVNILILNVEIHRLTLYQVVSKSDFQGLEGLDCVTDLKKMSYIFYT